MRNMTRPVRDGITQRNIRRCCRYLGSLLVCFLILAALFVFSGCELGRGGEVTVPVMLADAEGLRVLSENPAYVPIGEKASFRIEIDEDVAFSALPEGVTVEDGVLTVSSVVFPRTLKLDTVRRVLCEFSADVAASGTGALTSSIENGTHWSGTEITLTAIPENGYHFTGFSVGATEKNGGEIVALEPTYTFVLSEGVRVYANFAREWSDPALTVKVPKDKWVLIYHANGGYLKRTGEDGTKTVEFSSTYYHCPNTLADRDYFERDGYVLYGYNTEPDGSGTYYGPGWNVVMPERGAISLFCMWAKVSDPADFEYRLQGDNVFLTKYNGDDEFVVIPETIDGHPVYAIITDTFLGNETMKSVMITKNVRRVMGGAFTSCTALESLYFSDSVTEVSDGSFRKCDELRTLYMLAVVQPRYLASRNGTYAIKYERLITAEGKKLVIASGSNSAYGVNSPYLEELLSKGGHPYSVVNYGQNASTPLSFYVEVISAHLDEGDLLVIAPESNNKAQFGYNEIGTTVWQIFEGAYDAFSHVDIRHYANLFTSFASFNSARNHENYDEACYETYTTDTVNSYGDYSKEKVGYEKNYASTVQALLDKGGVGTWNYASTVNHLGNYASALNRTLDLVSEKGAEVLISFAATNIITMNAASQIPGGEAQKAYEDAVDKMLHGTRISRVATYTMATELFYNSHNHPTSEGATLRTEWLADDILAYLKSDKKS